MQSPTSTANTSPVASSIIQISQTTTNKEFDCHVAVYSTKLLYNDQLRVSQTTLPGCQFLGLFASRPFKAGAIVCKYVGDRYRTAQAIKLKDKSYLMRLGEQSYVNAEPYQEVKARFINDCINPIGWNVEFVKLPDRGCALVVALRDIQCNEELFVSYGARYWMLQRPVKLTDRQVLEIQRKQLTNCVRSVDGKKDSVL